MPNALMIDVSRWNDRVNWQIAKEHQVVCAGVRASMSYAYRDPMLAHNQQGTLFQGIFRIYYHVLYPGESIPRQADNFLAAVGNGWQNAVPALDIELHHNQGKNKITGAILEWSRVVKNAVGVRPLLYSTAAFINRYTHPGDWRKEHDWWLANYLFDRTTEHPGPPRLPSGVTTWLIHQTADKIEAWPGLNGPEGIQTIDYNRWHGDALAVRQYFGAPLPAGVIVCPNCGYTWQGEL